MNKLYLFISLLLAAAWTPSSAQTLDQIKGSWKYQDLFNEMVMVISANGKMEIGGNSFTCRVNNGVLEVEGETGWVAYPMVLTKEEMTLTFPEGYSLIFTRMGPASPVTAPAQPARSSEPSPSKHYLTGKYVYRTQQGQVFLHFLSASELEFDGERTSYRISGNNIQTLTDYGWEDYPFSFEGETLWITFPDGARIPFTPVAEASQQTQPGTQQPTAGGGGNAWQLQGSLCHYAGSSSYYSSYSRLEKLSFDGKGNFAWGSEAGFSSGAGLYYGNSPNVQRGTYIVEGKQVTLIYETGQRHTLQVYMQQNSGRITELMYNSKLYATGLCE